MGLTSHVHGIVKISEEGKEDRYEKWWYDSVYDQDKCLEEEASEEEYKEAMAMND